MKKILVSLSIAAVIGLLGIKLTNAQSSFTGAPAPITTTVTVAANTPLIAITGNVQVVSVSIVSANTGVVNFYDCATLAAPINGTNFQTAAYTSRVSYATNYTNIFIGQSGMTITNVTPGWYSTNVTVAAATTPLPSMGSFGVIANTVSVYSSPMLFAQGVSVLSSVAGTVIIQYVPNK